jgi:hypothetical protein
MGSKEFRDGVCPAHFVQHCSICRKQLLPTRVTRNKPIANSTRLHIDPGLRWVYVVMPPSPISLGEHKLIATKERHQRSTKLFRLL